MRVEDRAYSLMGLLGVNMPVLYGEGAKAFHRLQLEVIRCSNDQSIFAWGWNKGNVRTGSILADDPSSFGDCSEMELMSYDEFIESLKRYTPAEALSSIDKDRLASSPSRIAVFIFGCFSVHILISPTPSSTPAFHAAILRRDCQWPLAWFCGVPIIISALG